MKVSWILPAFLLLPFALPAQQPAQPEYEVTVNTVTVWVKATDDKGNPVTGLKQEDFSVFEDETSVAPTCFEEMSTENGIPASAAKESPRRFVLFLDLYNTTPTEYLEVKPFLQDFIRTLYGKNVEMMLAALMPTQKLGVVAPFTKDLNRIRLLLNQATANSLRDVTIERKYDELIRVFEGAAGDTIEDLVSQAANDVETLAMQEQAESLMTLHSIENFASHVGSQQHGEQVIMLYVSGGFSAEPGRRYYEIIDRIAERRSFNDVLKFYSQRKSTFNFDKELEKSIGSLSRSNVAVYTIDTRGIVIRRKEYQDSLIGMAHETGGLAFYNSKNFETGLSDVLKDISHQYVICYSPPPHAQKGQFHKIRLETSKPGLQLRYRLGYFE